MGDLFTKSGAIMSQCLEFRYLLTRNWGGQVLPFIMLNPSTADWLVDDPTIGRCIEFARRDGYGGIAVANVFAFRATSPKKLARADDPVGPLNAGTISKLAQEAFLDDVPMVCAWGAHAMAVEPAKAVLQTIADGGAKTVCLGVNKDGSPRHPLYVRGDQPLVPYEGARNG